MAELTITPANVKITSSTITERVQLGEAADQGETVCLKSDGKYWLADNGTTVEAAVKGVVMTPNVADGSAIIAKSGPIDLGATLSVGQTYSQAATPGKIELESDVGTGEYMTNLGIATTTALLNLKIDISATAHA